MNTFKTYVFILVIMHKNNRKIIPIGKTSFAVILPISWLRYNNLTDKDHVEVISNGVITIKPQKGDSNGLV
jgi:hypothetical protein